MKKQTNNKDTAIKQPSFLKLELYLLIKFALGLFILIALINYSPEDMSWNVASNNLGYINNSEGLLGAWIADFFYSILGLAAYIIPLAIAYNMLHVFISYKKTPEHKSAWHQRLFKKLLLLWFVIIIAAFISLYAPMGFDLPAGPGGMVGQTLSWFLLAHLSNTGTLILLLTAILMGLRYYVNISFLMASEKLGQMIIYAVQYGAHITKKLFSGFIALCTIKKIQKTKEQKEERMVAHTPDDDDDPETTIELPTLPTLTSPANIDNQESTSIPTLSMALLHKNPTPHNEQNQAHLENTARLLEHKLLDFSIQAQVIAAYPGPVVTLYELELAAGVKVNKVTQCSKDIARSLSVTAVRVREVMPGKPTIGIEIPNENKEMVYISDILNDSTYQSATSPLTVALGKDIAGIPTVTDLARMPHLLIAGTTGSGKSVCINTILISLLYKASPEEVRLILIDPKMLELSIYKDIPHLLTPVVTQMNDAAAALKWCVKEMDRRYALMAELGVRHCDSYNEKIRTAAKEGTPIPLPQSYATKDQPNFEPIPKILVLADEFADLMMVSSKKVEQYIARIAQKARASGIHLILATQRPSVDVITGLIKANIPARISFQVSSRIDSRTILDQQGAEQLLGHGDMLFLPPGTSIPQRIHGAFVSDEEVHRVITSLKKAYPTPNYISDICDESTHQDSPFSADDGEQDPLYDQAVATVIKAKKVSVSMIQRYFKIGYNRAARIVDTMEAAGLVSPMQHNGSRTLLTHNHHDE